ncbi:hypothetical protein SEA_ACOLYTE_39 [Mycobacterium phage Acolyte]|nr:hypothetical protein SEA_ACOLYTE_39 [Mycobacterium phage Acolyte]
MEQFYLPVAMYPSGPSLHTGSHGPRYYASEESAKKWRSAHNMGHLWRILELTIEEGKEPSARWCD